MNTRVLVSRIPKTAEDVNYACSDNLRVKVAMSTASRSPTEQAYHSAMPELLWKLGTPDLPIEQQEYVELAIEEPPNAWGEGVSYVVRRTRYEWDQTRGQMMVADHIIDQCKRLETAQARYAVHRQILVDGGFIVSNREPIL